MLDGPTDSVVAWIVVVPQIDVVVFRKLVKGREMVLNKMVSESDHGELKYKNCW